MTGTFTLIDDGQVTLVDAAVEADAVRIAPSSLERATGWVLKLEGLCRAESCVPVRDRDALVAHDGLDLAAFAELLGRPLALDVEERAAALGTPAANRAALLDSGEAPDFTLPDLEGKLHSLSDHRGKKVLLIAYASW